MTKKIKIVVNKQDELVAADAFEINDAIKSLDVILHSKSEGLAKMEFFAADDKLIKIRSCYEGENQRLEPIIEIDGNLYDVDLMLKKTEKIVFTSEQDLDKIELNDVIVYQKG